MTSRRTAHSVSTRSQKRSKEQIRRRLLRGLHVESLEDRRLMALGPQLVGIQPDDGHLLQPNETLNIAPLDLTFRFDETTQIDYSTVNGIQLWRTGFDNQFTPASVASDLLGTVERYAVPNERGVN